MRILIRVVFIRTHVSYRLNYFICIRLKCGQCAKRQTTKSTVSHTQKSHRYNRAALVSAHDASDCSTQPMCAEPARAVFTSNDVRVGALSHLIEALLVPRRKGVWVKGVFRMCCAGGCRLRTLRRKPRLTELLMPLVPDADVYGER